MLAAVLARTALLVGLVASGVLATGCSTAGAPLADWTLDVDGGPHAVALRLPSPLPQLAGRDAAYTLRTTVALPAAERGHALSLVIDCFHGELTLAANDVGVPVSGGDGVGAWRFTIDPTLTRGEQLTLVLGAHRDAQTVSGFGVAPRLVDGTNGDARSRAVAAFNRYSAIVALCFLMLLGVIYTGLFLLDRKRLEYAAMVAYGVTVANAPLAQLGAYQLFGSAAQQVSVEVAILNFGALLYLVHLTFALGPVRRAWLIVLACEAVLIAATLATPGLILLAVFVHIPIMLAVNWYAIVRFIQLTRHPQHRIDAHLMLWGSVLPQLCMLQGIAWVLTGDNWLGGVHPLPAAISITALLQSAVLSRQHAARQRAIEVANAELQRQVAERSRELGDALAKLASKSSPPLVEGRTIDTRYRVIKRVGSGGMGAVYEVERVTDRQRLALKVMRSAADSNHLARFAREAQVAAELSHPNLVPVLDVGITDEGLFFVMPLVDDGSLEQQRARFGDVKWARPLLAQIAAGLAALHDRGIVHRDLKPANVLLAGGVARIADFGLASLAEPPPAGPAPAEPVPAEPVAAAPVAIAGDPALAKTMTGKLHRDDKPAQLTKIGDIFGTPGYMAPELIGGVHAVKPSSDIYAFGLIAVELLTADKAFDEPPLQRRLAGKDVPPPRIAIADAGLQALVARCLDLAPAQRPTASELAAALAER